MDAPTNIADRYEDLGPIAIGGMGEVRRVRDRWLGRVVAIKLLPRERALDPAWATRFALEARQTARLQHPSIVAVHDLGRTPDGRWWYTMPEIRGETLADALRGRERALRRFVEILAQVGQAVASAHARGVVHRDLKPHNVMIGEFGEVVVLDWGLVKGPAVPRVDDAYVTQVGEVVGTPAYMAPEQARGEVDEVGPAADVYGLGAMLYEILTGGPPHRGDAALPTLLRASFGSVVRVTAPDSPAALAAACEDALSPEPSRRPDAPTFVRRLREWLDGERRVDEARDLVARAEAVGVQVREREEELAMLRGESRAERATVPRDAGPTAKRRLWRLEDAAEAVERSLELALVEQERYLTAASGRAPEAPDVRAAVAAFYRRRLIAAEHDRDVRGATRAEALLRALDHAETNRWLDEPLVATVEGAPDATCEVARFVEVDRRRVPRPVGGPERGRWSGGLAPGSYLARVSGRAAPFLVERGATPVVVSVDVPEGLGPDDVLVPAGPFVAGGDRQAIDAYDRTTVHVPTFVMRRHPVTNAEYAQFLLHLVDAEGPAAATRFVPALPPGQLAAQPLVVHLVDGRIRVTPGAETWPVVLVDLEAAEGFARWSGWRLPTELEFEKAARGVDGRYWPWGDHHEPAWARCIASVELPSIAPVDDHPEDESPYGIRGLAGNVRTWTATAWRTAPVPEAVDPGPTAPGEFQVVKGGSWSSAPELCRPANRFGNRPTDRFHNIGIRLVRSIDPGCSTDQRTGRGPCPPA